jgi:PhnB protein
MDFAPYLNFNGNCAEAFRFYQTTLRGKLVALQTHAESPIKDQVPPEWRDAILHARLEVGSRVLMGSDAPAAHYRTPQGMSVSISVATFAEAQRIFNAFAQGGTITMPFAMTFWSSGFGMLVDRFGIPWVVNCEQPA